MIRASALIRGLLLLIALLVAGPAAAHFTPNSEVRLDFGAHVVEAEVIVPASELGYAVGRRLTGPDGTLAVPTADMLKRYIAAHVGARAADGRPWTVLVRGVELRTDEGAPDVRFHLALAPPAGADVRRFDLSYSAVIDRIPNHFVLVVARSDFAGGHLAEEPEIVGGLQGRDRSVSIDRGSGHAGAGFVAAIGLGMHHIAEGHDHLLFLITLLMPAPLIAAAGRWSGYGGARLTARRLIGVVTAFTVGHSLTLLGGAFLGWKLPAQPVEIMIAVSILVSAVHAARPLFAGREPIVAAGFGLIHGLAFATIVGRVGIEPWQKAQAILGFNIGIEIVQLLVVAGVLPALLLLARTRWYPALRLTIAAFAGVAALAWIVERSLETANPVARLIDSGLAGAPWLWAALTLAAIAAWLHERKRAAA